MNTKTTITLALLLLLAVGGLYFVKTRQPAEATPSLPPEPTQAATTKVFEEDLGEIVKVTVVKGSAEPLVFEKKPDESAAGPTWHVIAPFEAKANTWEIDRIPQELGRLSYEISYKPGESGGVTPEQAGLAPPTAVITVTNAEGKEAKVEVGKPAAASETYVRVAGDEAILVAKSRVADLIKKSPAEYRDAQVWSFEPGNVKRVEIVDRTGSNASTVADENGGAPKSASATTYVFVRDGDKWMMESPVTARATAKVEDALKTVSKLRVLKWEPQAQPRSTGLEPAAITATFTVEEKIPVEKAADEEKKTPEGEEQPEPATETKTRQYTLHISSLSPIGEDTKTYVRVGEETAVATIMKAVADKVKPEMNQWREMRLITEDVQKASKVELTVGGESATLNKTTEGWEFEAGGKADAAEVNKLLEAAGKLEAKAFVEGAEGQPSDRGFDNPRARITFTIPGVEGSRGLTIGGHTEQQTKAMAYVRRDDANTAAKVLEAELSPLLRGPSAYQDRTVLSIAPADVGRLAITRENPFSKSRESIVLELVEESWRMTEPVAADARQPKVQELLDALASLQAERVVPSAETESIAAKLQEPNAHLTIIHQQKLNPAADDSATVEAPGPQVTTSLAIAPVNGKPYAKVGENPAIYELPQAFLDKLSAEYRDGTVLKFNSEDVTKFTVKEGDASHTFVRHNEKWAYEAEPDLPLDQTKVDALLAQFQNLQTEHFSLHDAGDTAFFGLNAPEREVRITAGGRELVLAVSAMQSQVTTAPGRYATSTELPGIFLLPEAAIQQMRADLDSLGAS